MVIDHGEGAFTRYRHARTIGIVAYILAVMACDARAQLATTAWPMAFHDLQHTGRSSSVGPSTGTIKWTFPTRGFVKGSPIIGADGTVYIGIERLVLGIRKDDASAVWTSELPAIVRRNAPALASDGTLYIGARDNRLWAIAGDGSQKWSFAVGNDGDVNTSPAIAPDGTVYMSGTFNGIVHALNPDGTLKWKLPLGPGVSYSSPALATDGTMYIGSTAGKLHALNPDGTLKWETKVGRRVRFASPVVATDGTIYIGTATGLAAVWEDGTERWFAAVGNVVSTPALGADGTVYVGTAVGRTGSGFYALDPTSGEVLWSYAPGDRFRAAALVDANGTIYTAAGKRVIALAPDGTLRWEYLTGRTIVAAPALDGDGTLYVGSDGLYAFADPPPQP